MQPGASVLRLPRRILIGIITVYQHTLSPDHGPLRALFPYGYCRHEPTCSAYGKTVIDRYGAVRGGWKLFRRLLTCNPWTTPTRLLR